MARLYGSVTQGGADAFAIASIGTALSGQTRQAYNVQKLTVEVSAGMQFNANAEIELCLLRRTKAAMVDIDDPDVLQKWKQTSNFTTSGAHDGKAVFETLPPDRTMIIVEDPIYWAIDSNATTATQNALIVIEFEIITLSEVDRLSILVESLS